MRTLISRVLYWTVVLTLLTACTKPTIEEPTPDGIVFQADLSEVQPGQCTLLVWDVSVGFGVTLDGVTVNSRGNQEVCPTETTSYALEVDLGTSMEHREVEVRVSGPGQQPQTSPGGGGEGQGAVTVIPGVPAYQAESWIALGGPPGGLGYDIRMQPDNPDTMYVTDGFTGFFKSTNGGESWFPINVGIEPFPGAGTQAFSVTIDPHDYNTIWGGLQLSGHIYRSTNGGQTWEQRDNGLLFEDCLRSVRGITVDPSDPQVVYAGVEVGSTCWLHQTVSHRQELVRGEVYKSTDAGQNWRLIWQGDNLARYIWVDPRNSNRIYVSTGLFDRDAANSDIFNGVWGGVGILRSDDGGQTWIVLDQTNGLGGLYVPSLFMHPEDPDTLLAAVTYPADPGGEGSLRHP